MKTYAITIRRKDATVPLTEEEKKKGFPVKQFIVRVNAEIPPSHRICEGSKITF